MAYYGSSTRNHISIMLLMFGKMLRWTWNHKVIKGLIGLDQ